MSPRIARPIIEGDQAQVLNVSYHFCAHVKSQNLEQLSVTGSTSNS
jgi:hypothetical protein